MNKKQQEELRRQEDQALVRGMLWVACAVVLELLLFLLNRYTFKYGTTVEAVELASNLRVVLKGARIVGAVLALAGVVLTALQLKKGAKTGWYGVLAIAGTVVMLCAHVAVKYHESGMQMLYLLVPVLGGLALCFYIYPRDFFLSALPAVAAVLGLWFVRVAGIGLELALTVLICAAVLLVVLMLKKGDGAMDLAGQSLRMLGEKINYIVPMASGVAALAVQVLAAVAGGTIAYYLIFAMGAWLFALLVYYTVKML